MNSEQHAAAPVALREASLGYAGWRVVLTCFLMALFLFGFAFYGQGVYIAELQRVHGWSPVLIAGASTLTFLISNISAVFTNELVVRFGAKRLVLFGLAALSASTTMIAMASEPWQIYAAFILMSFAWIGMGTVVIALVVSLWFVHRRGLAISLAFTGNSAGGVLIVPLLLLLVERIGFQAALLLVTAIMVAVLVPAVIAWIASPAAGDVLGIPSGARPPVESGKLSRAKLMRSVPFWTVSAAVALALVAQVGFIVHQIAALEPKIGRSAAGIAVSLLTFMALAGRLAVASVIDRLDPRLVMACSLMSQAAALLIVLQSDHVWTVWAACAVFGFSVGNVITMPALVIVREFDAASFATVMGLSNAISGTICALGPGLVGVIRSWSGGYDDALKCCILLELIAAVVVMEQRLFRHRASR